MAEELAPIIFRKSPENVISYSFTDSLLKTGYITYYYKFATSGDFFTINSNIIPSKIVTGIQWSETYNLISDHVNATEIQALSSTQNFDIEFKVPITIKGDFFTNMEWGFISTSSLNTQYVQFKFRPYHYDGATETALAAQQTESEVGFDDSPEIIRNFCWKMNLAEHNFKVGDKLRLKIEIWIRESSDYANIYQDHRLYGDSTSTQFLVPIKMSN
jgi:hypothetical protein